MEERSMVYDNNGIPEFNEIIVIGESTINLAFLESVKDEDVEELKQLIKDSSNESADKIKNLDSRFKFLKEKTKSILKKLELISTGGGIGTLIGSAVNLSKNKNGIGGFLFAVSIALFGVLTAMDRIITKNDEKKVQYKKELNELADEAVKILSNSLKDKNLSAENRNKIMDKIEKISKLADKGLTVMKNFIFRVIGSWTIVLAKLIIQAIVN